MINVSLDDAANYIVWLRRVSGKPYRLLSESEWEYCCRAGTTTKFAFGDTITSQQAQFSANQTADVGKFPPNAWGLYDMHGNVSEWCEDAWHDSYQGAPNDGSAWVRYDTISRVIRSGSWLFNRDLLLSAYRSSLAASQREHDNGFRVARDLE